MSQHGAPIQFYEPCRKCSACGGAAHPATGCEYSATVIVCGPCVRRFWRWARAHMHARKGQPDFYGSIAVTAALAEHS